MASAEGLETRVTALESQMAEVRKDVAEARLLARAADRDVSEFHTKLNAHTKLLNALRDTQVEQGKRLTTLEKKVDVGFAKIDDRFAKVDARLDKMDGRFDKMDGRLDKMDGRLDKMDGRLDKMDGRFDKMDDRFARLESKVDNNHAETSLAMTEITGLLHTLIGRTPRSTE